MSIIIFLFYSNKIYLNILALTLFNFHRFILTRNLENINLIIFREMVKFIEIFTFKSIDYINFINVIVKHFIKFFSEHFNVKS